MTKIALFAGGDLPELVPDELFDIYVGVDVDSLFLAKAGLPLDFAVGDFDSVSEAELSLIRQCAKEFLQAPAEKDDTDLELALKEMLRLYPDGQISIYGAFGGRLDHMMANLFLPSEPAFSGHMQQIQLCDEQNIVRFYPEGKHKITPIEGMEYIAFMPSDDSRLEIKDAKYPLNASNYFFKKCYTSNEFIDRDMIITLDKGYVVVIYSRD
ncbi:thiamine diphosphokinase [Streptococcus sp. X16XC17]|uniref:thiamine diphosphokinase n=1 Tax=unclassified Streptococcus TaxID=2608887 RepID=UPI00066FB9E1|nr:MULTISPECIES: thiamine diphosphokinase [unclassified Streptococcus]TCD45799.1 thiamine diphosphokinase [Streptococcus sp. X16XC17]